MFTSMVAAALDRSSAFGHRKMKMMPAERSQHEMVKIYIKRHTVTLLNGDEQHSHFHIYI